MKIYIGPYRNWVGPYQIAEKILFWLDKDNETVYKLGNFLAFGKSEDKETKFYKFLTWIHNNKKRKIKIHIDNYDTWSMDNTLALIILPMLKQLKEAKHGSPFVDNEDVPESLQSEEEDSIHDRWNYVLDEIIWSFEHINSDWEEQFMIKKENFDGMFGKDNVFASPYNIDLEGMKKYRNRISKGLILFGKYYQTLWD